MEHVEELEIPTCLPALGTRKTRRLKRLVKRAKYLKQRIEQDLGSENSLRYDEEELSALRYVIKYILTKEGVIRAETEELQLFTSETGTAGTFSRLIKRIRYLNLRIEYKEGSENSLRYAIAELSALRWAMEYILIKEGILLDTGQEKSKAI